MRKYYSKKSLPTNTITNEMQQFLEIHKLPKLTKEEIDKPNCPMSIKEINLYLKSIK